MLAMSRLQTVFITYLLRRRKDTELDGKRLIELPKKTVDLCILDFTPEEQEIYDHVSRRWLSRESLALILLSGRGTYAGQVQ